MSRNRNDHDIESTLEIEIEVSGSVVPYKPMRYPSPSCECGEPAEGGEIEDFIVMWRGLNITDKLTKAETDALQEELYESKVQYEEGYEPDPDAGRD